MRSGQLRLRGIGLCLVGLIFCVSPMQSQPTQMGEAAHGEHESSIERRIRFYQRQIVEMYLQYGNRDPWLDESVISFLDGFVKYVAADDFKQYPRIEGTPTLQELRTQRRQLMAAGVHGPILNYVFSLVDPIRNNFVRPIEIRFRREMREHGDRLGKPDLFRALQLSLDFYVLRNVYWHHSGQRKWFDNARANKVRDYTYLFKDHVPLTIDDQIEFALLFDWFCDDIHIKQVESFQNTTYEVSPEREWLAKVCRGVLLVETAWEERGGGWASTVEDQGWQRFAIYLDLAEAEFDAAWRMHPERSKPASMMIKVAMGQSSGEEWTWFKRAMAADPLDTQAFDSMRWAHRERWGGDVEQALAVAEYALSSQRFDTDVPEQFDLTITDMIDDYGYDWLRPKRFGGVGADAWMLIQSYLDGRAAEPTPTKSADWCWSRGFGLGYRSGRLADVAMYFDRLDEDPTRLRDIHEYGIDRRWIPGEFMTRREPAVAEAIKRSEVHRVNGELGQAIQTLADASGDAQHPVVQTHLRDHLRVMEWTRSFKQGQWVDLLEHGFEGWRPTRGWWKEATTGVGGMHDSDNGGLRMIAGLEPGRRYEAELQVRLPDGFYINTWGGAGFVLDPVIGRRSGRSTLAFLTRAPQSGVWIQDPGHDEEDDHKSGADAQGVTVTLRLVRWDQQIQLWVDGAFTSPPHTLQTQDPQPRSLGIGAYHSGSRSVYGFEAVRIRKLERSPFAEEDQGLVMADPRGR